MVVPLLAWLFPGADPRTLELMHAAVRKLGHFMEYLILGLLVTRALAMPGGWRPRHAVLSVALAACYAVSAELHQRFVPGRTAALGDVGIDTLGAIAGQVGLAVRRRRARRVARPARPGPSAS
jgi:VanZ family protein